MTLFSFVSFHFGLLGLHFGHLGLHFLSLWPFGTSFPFILAFWAFISFHFGLLGPRFLHFWLVWAATWGPLHKLTKTARFLMKFKQTLSAPRPAAFVNFWPFGLSFPFILAFWAFISFHFGFLGCYFLSFYPFGPSFLTFWPFRGSFPFLVAFWASFPFILVFWAFISFHFGLLGPRFFHFWLVWAATWGPPPYKLPKTARFLMKF